MEHTDSSHILEFLAILSFSICFAPGENKRRLPDNRASIKTSVKREA